MCELFLENLVPSCCMPNVPDSFSGFDDRAMYTPMTLFYILMGLQVKSCWWYVRIGEVCGTRYWRTKGIHSVTRYHAEALSWLFGSKEVQDELIALQFQFGCEFPGEDNPEAVGLASRTSLLVVDNPPFKFDVSDSTFDSFEMYHQNAELIRNFYFRSASTYIHYIYAEKQMGQKLSDQATITLVMADMVPATLTGSKQMLNMKSNVKYVSTFPKNEKIQAHGINDGQLSCSPILCKEFHDRYEIEIKINNQGEKIKCNSEYFFSSWDTL